MNKCLLIALSSGLILPLSVLAATPQEVQQQAQQRQQQMRQQSQQRQQEAQQRQQQVQQQAQQRQQQMQQQSQERQQQEQQMRQQQEQARQQHEQEMRQAAQNRQQQEQNLRQQEQQSKQQQQEATRQQAEQARQQQEQLRQQQQQATQNRPGPQNGIQNGAHQLQDQMHVQKDQERARQEQMHAQQEHGQQDQMRQQQEQAHQPHDSNPDRIGRPGNFANDRNGAPVTARDAHPPALPAHRLPLSKAIAMPILARNANPDDRRHLEDVQRNLQAHLIAVSDQDRPTNINRMRDFAREQYFNNYQATIANQQYTINRQNTFINALEQNQWPAWYQPQPNYQFCNGFTFGNSLQADLNWLRWGWHPYYGPQPEGFVCARDYVPTPWIFIPAYGTWRQPGVNAYAPYGPPYDYTGPISVEVFEPRQVNVGVPFGGWLPQQVVNVIYFYNAYYFPEYGRYGYMNRLGNWIWLDLNPQPY